MRHSRFLVGSCGAAFAIMAFVIGLEVSATTAAPSVNSSSQIVNRALKSDRLPQASKGPRNAVNGPEQVPPRPILRPVLLDGCEPLVSPISQSPLSLVAGRCVS
jgi:hypothetical protein